MMFCFEQSRTHHLLHPHLHRRRHHRSRRRFDPYFGGFRFAVVRLFSIVVVVGFDVAAVVVVGGVVEQLRPEVAIVVRAGPLSEPLWFRVL